MGFGGFVPHFPKPQKRMPLKFILSPLQNLTPKTPETRVGIKGGFGCEGFPFYKSQKKPPIKNNLAPLQASTPETPLIPC